MERLLTFIREIHRRSLWQVLGIYVVASWGVLSVVDTLAGALSLPGEALPAVAPRHDFAIPPSRLPECLETSSSVAQRD